ncbi:thiol-disulfide oxidoreductase, partial [Mesorhizobium sp. M00.F.Ca.ET.186.01.1.1]
RIGPIPTTFFIAPDGEVKEIFIGQLNEAMIADKMSKILPK